MVRFNKHTKQYEKISEAIVIDPSVYSLDEAIDDNGIGHLFLRGVGIQHNLEMSDYNVHKGDLVPYHYHEYGFELFVLVRGSVIAVAGGKKTAMLPGDMLLIRPWVPHAFEYQEDGTVWYEVIHGMALWEAGKSLDRIIKNCPEKFEDHEFMREYFSHEGRIDYLGYPYLNMPDASACEVPGFSGKGKCYRTYRIPGIECRLKYPRWQLGGLKEIWEFVLDQGVSASWSRPYPSPELMMVCEGNVSVEVQGYETMTAKTGDIIKIPDYTKHSITALNQGTVLQDFNVQFDMFLMMDEIETIKRKKPKTADIGCIKDVMSRYECPITAIGGILEV